MIRAMLIIGGAALIVGLTLYTLLDAVRTPAPAVPGAECVTACW